MATFTCGAHLAEVARACGFEVRDVGTGGLLFRVELRETGQKAQRIKARLKRAAFLGLSGRCPSCTQVIMVKPEFAKLIFDLDAPIVGRPPSLKKARSVDCQALDSLRTT